METTAKCVSMGHALCLICKFRGPAGTKRGDESGMRLEEGEVTDHSLDHIGGPF